VTDVVLIERLLEFFNFLIRNWLGPPLIVVLRENLDAIAIGSPRCPRCLPVAACDRHVGTENGHLQSCAGRETMGRKVFSLKQASVLAAIVEKAGTTDQHSPSGYRPLFRSGPKKSA
jgi:hypothetical protein